ncbi:MAG: hypothetical protein KF725_07705 [Cyclobacteriaceae bacterium]|nr:hypothetical protein [Cyclobacteriaceae bacterium]UYN87844.1 MAG: hypothetical protein KIT51_06200 [Cyclobacteriaceae bacterium]
MKHIILIVLLAGQLTNDKPDFFLFDQKKVKDITTIEESFKSQKRETRKVTVSDDFFPGATKYDLEFPITFDRKDKEFNPFSVVQYYYTPNDSLVRLIVYDWDKTQIINNFIDLQKELKNESKRINEYNTKYDELLKNITDKLGRPISGDGKIKEIKDGQSSYIERKSKWTRDNCTVELNMIFTTDNRTMGTFRIRTKIYWD